MLFMILARVKNLHTFPVHRAARRISQVPPIGITCIDASSCTSRPISSRSFLATSKFVQPKLFLRNFSAETRKTRLSAIIAPRITLNDFSQLHHAVMHYCIPKCNQSRNTCHEYFILNSCDPRRSRPYRVCVHYLPLWRHPAPLSASVKHYTSTEMEKDDVYDLPRLEPVCDRSTGRHNSENHR